MAGDRLIIIASLLVIFLLAIILVLGAFYVWPDLVDILDQGLDEQ